MKVYVVATSNAPYGLTILALCASEKVADLTVETLEERQGLKSFVLGTWDLLGDEVL